MSKHGIETIAMAVSLALLACGCNHGPQGASPAAPSAAKPATAPVSASGASTPAPAAAPSKPAPFELSAQYNPCDDFYDYVNAKWTAAHPIPSDHSSWGAFDELQEKNLAEQRAIVEAAAQSADHDSAGFIAECCAQHSAIYVEHSDMWS